MEAVNTAVETCPTLNLFRIPHTPPCGGGPPTPHSASQNHRTDTTLDHPNGPRPGQCIFFAEPVGSINWYNSRWVREGVEGGKAGQGRQLYLFPPLPPSRFLWDHYCQWEGEGGRFRHARIIKGSKATVLDKTGGGSIRGCTLGGLLNF